MGLFDLPKELRAKIHGEKDLKEMFFEILDKEHDLDKALSKVFETIDNETMFNVAVVGRSGAGKSSLINALAGLQGANAAPVGRTTDKTTVPGEYSWGKITIVDFPGYDTTVYKHTDFIKQLDFIGYDLTLNVTDSKISQAMQEVRDVIISKKIDCVAVVTRVDTICGDPKEIKEEKDEIILDIRDKLQYKGKVYFVCSNPRSKQYKEGIDILKEYIENLAIIKMKEIKYERCKKIIDVINQEYSEKCKAKAKEISDADWWRALGVASLKIGIPAAALFAPMPGIGFAAAAATSYLVDAYFKSTEREDLHKAFGIQNMEHNEGISISDVVVPAVVGVVKDQRIISEGVKAIGIAVKGALPETITAVAGPAVHVVFGVAEGVSLASKSSESERLQQEVEIEATDKFQKLKKKLDRGPEISADF